LTRGNVEVEWDLFALEHLVDLPLDALFIARKLFGRGEAQINNLSVWVTPVTRIPVSCSASSCP
jgi:hypothetical protein